MQFEFWTAENKNYILVSDGRKIFEEDLRWMVLMLNIRTKDAEKDNIFITPESDYEATRAYLEFEEDFAAISERLDITNIEAWYLFKYFHQYFINPQKE